MGRFGKFFMVSFGKFLAFEAFLTRFVGFMTNRTDVCSMKNSY